MWDKVLRHAHNQPDALAVIGPNRVHTYAELILEAVEAAAYFQNIGFKNQYIGIALQDKIEEVVCTLAVLLSGNAFFLIPHHNRGDFQKHVPLALLLTDLSEFRSLDVKTISWKEIKSGTEFPLKPWWTDGEFNLSNPFCIYATSGSTASAKYVLHDYRSILEDTERQIEENQIHSGDKIDFLFAASFSSSLASIFPSFFAGACLVIYDLQESNLSGITQFWAKHRVTFTTITSSAFRAICRIYEGRLAEFTGTIRFLCLGGEAILPSDLELVQRYFRPDLTVQMAYASTETRTIASIKHYPSQGNIAVLHDGFPVRKKELRLVDESGQPCQEGQTGEVEVHSNFISLGYLVNGQLQLHPSIDEKRIYRTGDQARWMPDGGLQLLGRNQSQVKLNGVFVDLNKLEVEISQKLPKPIPLKLFVFRVGKGMEYLAAFLETGSSDQILNEEEFVTGISLTVMPRQWIFLAHFPLNSHGKIDKRALEQQANRQIERNFQSQIQDPLLRLVYGTWVEELGKASLGLDDDYFADLGGSSLSAELILGDLSQKLERNLPSQLINTHRTINKLAQYIRLEQSSEFPILEWISQRASSNKSYKLIFLEVGHFDSFQEILDSLERMENIERLVLRYDLYQILQGQSAAQQILQLVEKLRTLERFIVVGISFNGWLAAKIAERLGCPVILLDSPCYLGQNREFLNKSLSTRFDYVRNQIQIHGLIQILPQLASSFWRHLNQKLGFKKPTESIFQRSINEFLEQSSPVEKLTDLLYVYSTQSNITSENDISLWSEKTVDNFQLYRLDGRHLDACSPKFGPQVAKLITDFLRAHKI